MFGRGAGDQEAGVAAAVYGARLIEELGLGDDCQVWVTGTVMEEDCDGLCWQYILREKVLEPDVVVITEPTNLGVYRGHRGRMEIEVRTQGRSCHGSAPERGINAVYHMAPIIADVERLNEALAPTRRSVPRQGDGHDRRDPVDVAVALRRRRQLHDSPRSPADPRRDDGAGGEAVAGPRERAPRRRDRDGPRLRARLVDGPRLSHEEVLSHVAARRDVTRPSPSQAMAAAARWGASRVVGKWGFSTNGIATCGLFGVPTVGFGPGNEIHAHTPGRSVPDRHHLTRGRRCSTPGSR